MSGILDKKSRIIDFVITRNGREQIENGDIRYKFATFSDQSILYTRDHEKSKIKKSDITNSEFYYLPLETPTLKNSEINPEIDIFNIGVKNFEDDGTISVESKITDFLQNESTIGYFKKLNILRTKSLLDKNKTLEFIEPETNNNDFNLSSNSSPEKYPTIKQLQIDKSEVPVTALDKRLSFKTNFLFMPPTDISGANLYSNDSFRNIDDLDEENSTSFLLTSYNSLVNKSNVFESRDKEILNILDTMSKDKNLYKKVYELKDPTENDSFIFEMHEIKGTLLSKLYFIKAGEFYDKNTASIKKVYLVGKLYNTRQDSTDTDVLFMFNNGVVNLESDKEFTFSTFFSFVNLFTIVIE